MKMRALLPLCALLVLAFPAQAQSPSSKFEISLPLACELGVDCWFMNYTDHDAAEDIAKDAACNARTYDAHKGTDIAVRDWGEANSGVDVLAIAPGKVLRLRDGEPDSFKTREEFATISEAKKDCGNGLIIDHGQGWISQYCHLKNGSFKVNAGDSVTRGKPLAEVGMSGVTEHPHVHLSVIHEGKIIDPFTGRATDTACGLGDAKPLWGSNEINYTPFSLYDGGFDIKEPDFAATARGQRGAQPRVSSPALTFWASYFGAKQGDIITLEMRQPDGTIFAEQTITQDKTRARQYYFIGRKAPEGGFQRGTWKATATVTRQGAEGTLPQTNTLTRAIDVF